MKARLESGKVVKYSQIPSTIISGGKTYVNARRLTTAEQEALGFFDVFVPAYDAVTQVIYNLHFDNAFPAPTPDDSAATREVFTYDVKSKTISETVASLKTERISALKKVAYDKLATTDWYAIRKAEKGTAIPASVVTERDGIRTSVTTKEGEINALTTKASILKYDINF
jgi:hypothetical protein